MQSLKILTFNWHDPYISLFGRTAQEITVCDWMRRADGTQGWDYQKRPLPNPFLFAAFRHNLLVKLPVIF